MNSGLGRHLFGDDATCLLCGAFGPTEETDPCVEGEARRRRVTDIQARLWEAESRLKEALDALPPVPGGFLQKGVS